MEKMKLLLIEDDSRACENFKKVEKARNDIEFVGMTDSDVEGLKLVKQYMPDGIILDLELNSGKGSGSGFEFIKELKKLNFSKVPKLVVTTNVYSDTVYDYLHINKVDFIFYKKQMNYTENNVICTLLLLNEIKSPSSYNSNKTEVNKKADKEDAELKKISDKIDKELDLIGVGTHLQGRKYLHDAIIYAINTENDSGKVSIIQYLSKTYKKPNSTISRAMQNAILYAWRISSIEDLTTYYTAKINYETGIPTPTEFIYYYANKIKREI